MKKVLAVRPAVIALIIASILAHYPYVKDINITSISKHKATWTITGTITINPQEVPEELRYNRDPDGFIHWWEQHINEALNIEKIPVRVLKLELEFLSTSETADVIGFYVELKIGQDRIV